MKLELKNRVLFNEIKSYNNEPIKIVKGECGGMAMCATCQCYLESQTELPEQSDAELDMLDQAFFVKQNSRLGCQIQISDAIDGIILRLAPETD
jgi:2Fe-2S ferredoxin